MPRKLRSADNPSPASALINHVDEQESSPPLTLMGPPKGLSTKWKVALLPIVSMSTSAILYTIADPFVDQGLKTISSKPELWHKLTPVITRLALLVYTWSLKLDATNVFAVTLHIRSPYYLLLWLFYDISLSTLIVSVLIDAASAAISFILIGRNRPAHYAKRAAAKSIEAHALYDPINVALLTLLSASIYALSLYSLSLTVLPGWIVTNFYPVPSLERAYAASPTTFSLLCLPLGYAVREFLFGPATSVDAPTRTTTIMERSRTLYTLTFFETFLRTYTSLEGSTLYGAAIWAALWGSMVWLVSIALGVVSNGVEVDDTAAPVEVRDDVVVPRAGVRKSSRV